MNEQYVAVVHIQRARVTAVCAMTEGPVRATVATPTLRSVAFDAAVIECVRQVCEKAGLPAESLGSLVVGASFDSLRNARMLRHVPGGRYWRDVLATSLEFGLPVPATVHTAIELAVTAEAAARAEVLTGAGDFLLIRAQRHVEAGLVRNGSLRHEEFSVPDRAVDRLLIERLADLAEPLLRAGRPYPVVMWGKATSNDRLLRQDLTAGLRRRGLDVPWFPPSSAGVDAVLTGGLLLAAARVGVSPVRRPHPPRLTTAVIPQVPRAFRYEL